MLLVFRNMLPIWAGIIIGGSLIAAPAKFQVSSLQIETALAVGNAQFHWLGIAEGICLILVLLLVATPSIRRQTALSSLLWIGIAVALVGLQRLILFPPLDARTVAIIEGHSVGVSNLHLFYIVSEVGKVFALLFGAFFVQKEI